MEQSTIQIIFEQIKSGISAIFKEDSCRTILFGSYARGDQNPESDIDILVVLERNDPLSGEEKKAIRDISDRIFIDYDTVVQLFTVPNHLYKPADSLFFRTVEREGILI